MNKNVDLNEDKTTNNKDKLNVVDKSLRSLLFRERMRVLSPHCRPLKDRMMDKTLSYIDLLRLGPPPSRKNIETSKRLEKQK